MNPALHWPDFVFRNLHTDNGYLVIFFGQTPGIQCPILVWLGKIVSSRRSTLDLVDSWWCYLDPVFRCLASRGRNVGLWPKCGRHIISRLLQDFMQVMETNVVVCNSTTYRQNKLVVRADMCPVEVCDCCKQINLLREAAMGYCYWRWRGDLPSVSFSKEAGGRMKMVGVMRQRMIDGAMNRCEANVGRRRSSSWNLMST